MPDVSVHHDQSRTVLPAHYTSIYAINTAHPTYSPATPLDSGTVSVPSVRTDQGDLGRGVGGIEAWSESLTLKLVEQHSGVHGLGEGHGDAVCTRDSVACFQQPV